jgi:hypothetical protein
VIFEGLVGRIVERVDRHDFEVWETPAAGRPCFMVAAALSRQEALAMAGERSRTHLRPQVLVLDGRGNLVHRA